jgi:hypothetical protein
VDPLASERSWLTPYNFVQNNPLARMDPDGRLDTRYEDEFGNEILTTQDGSNDIVTVKNVDRKTFDYALSRTNVENKNSTDWNDRWTAYLGRGQSNTTSAQGFDIEKAIDFLNSNAYSQDGPNKFGKGQCSPFVPKAINAGLNEDKIPTNLAGSAYGPSLLKVGFTIFPITSLNEYQPIKGDVAVMNGPLGGRTCNTGIGGPCGHIQMFNGERWVSDFFQTRPFWPGSTYQNAKPQLLFKIYRWGEAQ